MTLDPDPYGYQTETLTTVTYDYTNPDGAGSSGAGGNRGSRSSTFAQDPEPDSHLNPAASTFSFEDFPYADAPASTTTTIIIPTVKPSDLPPQTYLDLEVMAFEALASPTTSQPPPMSYIELAAAAPMGELPPTTVDDGAGDGALPSSDPDAGVTSFVVISSVMPRASDPVVADSPVQYPPAVQTASDLTPFVVSSIGELEGGGGGDMYTYTVSVQRMSLAVILRP